MRLITDIWYGKHPLALVLAPLGWLYCVVAIARRAAYRAGWLRAHRVRVPVIVAGNLTAGGTGKTPLVIWLVECLRRAGYKPGVVSRGYGGRPSAEPRHVFFDSDPREAGDEPVLIARRCRCPVVVAARRARAAEALLARSDCDILIADDGLQHYALARDIEIVVIDGERRFGNGRCLPAGPLREPVARLRGADLRVVNGAAGGDAEYGMRLTGAHLYNVCDDAPASTLEALRGRTVHAVAGIGHPARFFTQVRAAGVHVIEHAFPDHHFFTERDLAFGDDLPVVMTEKDAVKCRALSGPARGWYVPVAAEIDAEFEGKLLGLLKKRMLAAADPAHGGG